MKKLITAIALLLATMPAMADPINPAIDYKCMGDCMAAGYQYGYCQRVCSF
jgi:hypothetical protein